jgi:predicted regulator of Ras-like GTPase activity (Roadblock/LC7/MglB family)
MSDVENVLEGLKRIGGVRNVLLVSTSGAHLGGDAPKNVHLETFSTMSAILLGAAHTATKELGERLGHVEVNLENSRILIHPAGSKALIVVNVENGKNTDVILKKSAEIGREIEKML